MAMEKHKFARSKNALDPNSVDTVIFLNKFPWAHHVQKVTRADQIPKNSLFYRTQNGARNGDTIQS